MLTSVPSWILFIAMCACGGASTRRDHTQKAVIASYCRAHACGSEPRANDLGDGCYVVDASLYQCAHDSPDEIMCLDVTPCTGACKTTITQRGRELDIDRCRPRWQAYRRAQHPLTCSPVAVQTIPAGLLPSKLDVPAGLVRDVERAGKVRLTYETEVCASTAKLIVDEASKTSGFPALDRWLRARLGGLDASNLRGACVMVALVLGPFECDTEKALL